MGNVPQNIIDDILGRIDIVETISSYIPLKQAGRNYKALCPFHHEKTSSFMVSRDKQIYHCFGCGAGGNALNFVMRFERLTFPETLEMMAKKAGVSLPGFKKEASSPTTRIYEINQMACDHFRRCLASSQGKAALEYLEKRAVSIDVIKKFGIGFAPESWDGLLSSLRAKNVPISLIEKAGLIIAKNNAKGYYDRFRQRVIFPIHDIKGRITAFGGRILTDEKDSPKYLNSPETAVYSKGKNLFGLYFSREAISNCDYVAIVEGYLDFLTPFSAGFYPIVASLGTALTPEQVRLLKRYTSNIIMIYDADSAGEMATLRGLDVCLQEDINVKVVSLDAGFDPDSFVREKGIAAFKAAVEGAKPLFDYKFDVLSRKYNPGIIEERAKIAKEMLLTISKFRDEIVKSEYIRHLADRLRVREDSLRMELVKVESVSKKTRPVAFEYRKASEGASPLEKMLFCVMLDSPRLVTRFNELLSPSDFQDRRLANLAEILVSLAAESAEDDLSHRLMSACCLDETLSGVVAELSAFSAEGGLKDSETIFNDCVSRIKSQQIKSRCSFLQGEIRKAEVSKDVARVDILVKELSEIIKKGGVNEKSKHEA